MRAFQDEAAKAEIAAVYYAGHAVEIGGTNYLIPTDAMVSTAADLATEATPLDSIFSVIEGARKLRLHPLGVLAGSLVALPPWGVLLAIFNIAVGGWIRTGRGDD